jgi:hypothetical protein
MKNKNLIFKHVCMCICIEFKEKKNNNKEIKLEWKN